MRLRYLIIAWFGMAGGISNAAASARLVTIKADAMTSLELLGWFFTQAFVSCFFVALLTVAAMHLLRPALRKAGQGLTLTMNAALPKRYYEGLERADRYYVGVQQTAQALTRLLYRLPPWLAPSKPLLSPEGSIESESPSEGAVEPAPSSEGNVESALPSVESALIRLSDRQLSRRVGKLFGFLLPGSLRLVREFGFKARSSYLPDELFMRTIESEAKAALAAPWQNPFLFTLVTVDAPDDARAVVAYLDALSTADPAKAAQLGDPNRDGDTTAAGIAAAEGAVAAAAESWLDRFQLSLATKALLVSRVAAIGAGIAFAGLAAGFVGWSGGTAMLMALGAAGGLFGLLIDDGLRALPFARGR